MVPGSPVLSVNGEYAPPHARGSRPVRRPGGGGLSGGPALSVAGDAHYQTFCLTTESGWTDSALR
jgi:hypothetical protein